MPSKSKLQHDLMQAACHSKEFADKIKISQDVACEFVEADKKEGLWQTEKNESDKQSKKKKTSTESYFIDWSKS